MPKIFLAACAILILVPTAYLGPVVGPFASAETQVDTYRVPLPSLDFQTVGNIREYISPAIPASFVFDALSASWQLPHGSELSLRYLKPRAARPAFTILRDDMADGGGKLMFSDLLVAPLAPSFQYHIVLPADAQLDGRASVTITYLKSPPTSSESVPATLAAGIAVKSRSAWGADEHLRTVEGWLAAREKYCEKAGCNGSLPQYRSSSEVMAEAAEAFPDEARIIREEWKMNGEEIVWPEEYVRTVKKFILHHTAENLGDAIRSPSEYSTAEFQAHLRSIYYYHAVVRGWGDIGYNYIIDPLGNVYQGRAGGDKVVGAHASGANQGSVGISLMGNFENTEPTARQTLAVTSLLAALGGKYRIDPNGTTVFRGNPGPAVVSHRDLGKTACPGGKFYADLPSVRADAHRRYVLGSGTEAEVISTATAFASAVGQKTDVELKVRNNTAQVWKKNQIQLTLARGSRRSLLYDAATWSSFTRPGTMIEQTVEPGGTATWKFKIVARKAGSIEEQFKFNIPGKGWLKADPVAIKLEGKPRSPAKKSLSPTPFPSPVPSASSAPMSSLHVKAANAVNPEIRIRLGYANGENKASFVTDTEATLSAGGEGKTVKANTIVFIERLSNGTLTATFADQTLMGPYLHFKPIDAGVVTVASWDRTPSWSKDAKVNYNKFRGAVRAINEDGTLKLVNYIRLEDYLLGIAESANNEPEGMRKLMAVLSRSYALFYADEKNRKFPGKPYDGSDNPAEYQYYLGYGFEILTPHWVQSVQDTRGLVVQYVGKVVKTPYFSSSDGRTRDPQDVWGWSAPYLKPVDDSVCPDKVLRGHGVGLSACGARQMIKDGKNYLDVIKHYYTDVTVEGV